MKKTININLAGFVREIYTFIVGVYKSRTEATSFAWIQTTNQLVDSFPDIDLYPMKPNYIPLSNDIQFCIVMYSWGE